MDRENFITANPLVTPPHIQPEWYFLFAYAVLRAIPRKLGGVVALLLAVSILFLPPFLISSVTDPRFSPFRRRLFWLFVVSFFVLT